ncbi:unnamed protein product [Prunus armeniaca]|uniref:Uncharacterized protein n=1 Tax=Prunus armeniaca TaxID=36596 RepID=A0A6J5TIC1_PRUAR|nr:unnamed protein product [Prunus armeniaca]
MKFHTSIDENGGRNRRKPHLKLLKPSAPLLACAAAVWPRVATSLPIHDRQPGVVLSQPTA